MKEGGKMINPHGVPPEILEKMEEQELAAKAARYQNVTGGLTKKQVEKRRAGKLQKKSRKKNKIIKKKTKGQKSKQKKTNNKKRGRVRKKGR
jgi:hypothetical protein